MGGGVLFHEDSRRLQDRFDSRRIARAIFPDCPRYIPAMQLVEPSVYAPRPSYEPPEPAWKSFPEFADCAHPRLPTAKG